MSRIPLCGALALAFAFTAACRQPAAGEAETEPAAGRASAQAPAVAVPARAEAAGEAVAASPKAVLIDFRAADWSSAPEPSEAERQRVTKLLGIAPDDVQLTSRLEGAFTRKGAPQVAVILVPGGANTIDPFPEPATLAVLEGDRVVARHTFGKDDGSWQWLRKAADIEGDGIDELLLTAGWVQMGEHGVNLLAASLAGGDYRRIDVFERVVDSDCQARRDVGGGKAQAAVISVSGGKLVQARYEADCPRGGAGEGWAGDPAAADYRPVAR